MSLGAIEVLISTDDGTIGEVSDLVLDSGGKLYAVDRQAGQVHVVDPRGNRRPSLGRPGAGPGEFAQPTSLEVRGDTLFVVDWGNGRLQGLTEEGVPLVTRPLPPGQAPSVGAGTWFVRPTWGTDSVLAVIHRPDLSPVAGLGLIVGGPTNTVDPRQMKRVIREGRVPDIFLNTAEAVIGPDSSVWMYVPARGTVQKFDQRGEALWSVELMEREHEELLARFQAENADKPSGPFALLRYVLDATLVDNELWLLLGNSLTGPASVRVVGPDGSLRERLEFPPVLNADEVAVDPVRGYVYFARGAAAEVVRVASPGM